VDERDDSVDDGYFAVDMIKYVIADVPTCVHNGAASFSFADGHAELHKWLTPELQIPQQSGLNHAHVTYVKVAQDNVDMLWIRAHSTYLP
jgi:prepilin-type processing-associated H-X9-DG protein